MFHHMTITEFRKDAARAADLTRNSHTPLLLTQGSKQPLVVMSLDDFGRYNDDTTFLMNNPRTHRELMGAIKDVNNGRKGFIKTTVEEMEAMVSDAEAKR